MIRTDLCAADAAALDAALNAAGLTRDNVDVLVDVIGIMSEETEDLDADGYPLLVPLEGWHANLYTAVPLTADQVALLPIIPTPATPWRRMAGETSGPP